jgi:hypothetical protein
MQAGHVTLTTTTEQIIGPVAGASWVTLFGAPESIYLAAAAGIDTTIPGNRGELCRLDWVASSNVGSRAFRIGEGESIFAAGTSGTATVDFVVFPE